MSNRMRARLVRGMGDETRDAFTETALPEMARAGTLAIQLAAAEIKAEARANIASAGFSQRWQNALRVETYPRGSTYSLRAAALVQHKIWYAGVFEDGATIQGKPFLWVPLPWAPKKIDGKKTTAARMHFAGVKLFPLVENGKRYLAANLNTGSKSRLGKSPKYTLSQLKKGRVGSAKKGRVDTTVPLFIGLRQVRIKKRLSIRAIIDRAAGRLAAHYYSNLKGD